MWFLSKRSTDQRSRDKKYCKQCDVWRELYESEKEERRQLQHTIFLRFGIINEARDPLTQTVEAIQHHRPSQVLRDLENKKRREAIEEIKKRVSEGVLNPVTDNATES